MYNNQSLVPASPGLSAIEEIVADLRQKYYNEEKRATELEQLLNESLSRRNSLDTAISLLKQEYKLTGEQEGGKGKDTKSWERPANVSWLELVKDAIRGSDNLLTNSEIMSYLGMDEEAKNKHKQTSSGAMANYRESGQLIGLPVYYKSQKGAAFSQYFTGIPSFYENIETKQLKFEYHAKLRDKLRERGLFLKGEEATQS